MDVQKRQSWQILPDATVFGRINQLRLHGLDAALQERSAHVQAYAERRYADGGQTVRKQGAIRSKTDAIGTTGAAVRFQLTGLTDMVMSVVSETGNEKVKMKCNECGATFKKKVGPKTYEVKCPKCGGYDTEIGQSYLMSKDGKTLYTIGL